MIQQAFRGAIVAATLAVSIPYAVAILANILHGWPQRKDKYRRALSPTKVFGVNYAVFQMLRDKSKYIRLYLKWRKFYQNADPKKFIKNIPYGRNDCQLDVHLSNGKSSEKSRVILFIYGGSWSSGDRSMYGLLARELATQTKSVVVCPTYSIYPKGYVDDMVQDVVDCISWVVENIHQYGGDPTKIVVIGHSAGAHLGALAILELLRDERMSVRSSFNFDPSGRGEGSIEDLAFAESHYGRRRDGRGDSSGSSESFAVVSDNGSMGDSANGNNGALESSTASAAGFLSVSTMSEGMEDSVSEGYVKTGLDEVPGVEGEERTEVDLSGGDQMQTSKDGPSTGPVADPSCGEATSLLQERTGSGSVGDDEDGGDDDSGDNDSIVTVRQKDLDQQATLSELCKSIRAFVGLAGVYSISDHFEHEFQRGIEDLSKMTRALYGKSHFERFSPLEIVQTVEQPLSFPPTVLIHGTSDYIVPTSSSSRFAEALAKISSDVKLKMIPKCPHYEVCLDLMDARQEFYMPVMDVLLETLRAVS